MLDAAPHTRLDANQHDSADSLARPPMSCGSRWHCVVTLPCQEMTAVGELANQHYRTFLPFCREFVPRGISHRVVDRIVPLFPRYAFVHFDPLRDRWGRIRHTRGVLALIRHAPESPTPVPHGVVENLMQRTSARGVVDDPGDEPRHIPRGAAVSVLEGPMAGLGGICTISSENRCSVLISMLGREVPVTMDPRHLMVA